MKNRANLVKKVISDKNGKRRTVWVKMPESKNQVKIEDGKNNSDLKESDIKLGGKYKPAGAPGGEVVTIKEMSDDKVTYTVDGAKGKFKGVPYKYSLTKKQFVSDVNRKKNGAKKTNMSAEKVAKRRSKSGEADNMLENLKTVNPASKN